MSDTTKPSGSLAGPITQPDPSKPNGSSGNFSPSATAVKTNEHTSWADELASPVAGNDKSKQLGGQVDGAPESLGGSQLLDLQQFEVEVKLSDIQGDVNSPLFSVSSFEELGV